MTLSRDRAHTNVGSVQLHAWTAGVEIAGQHAIGRVQVQPLAQPGRPSHHTGEGFNQLLRASANDATPRSYGPLPTAH